jgi:hypothetical protein
LPRKKEEKNVIKRSHYIKAPKTRKLTKEVVYILSGNLHKLLFFIAEVKIQKTT